MLHKCFFINIINIIVIGISSAFALKIMSLKKKQLTTAGYLWRCSTKGERKECLLRRMEWMRVKVCKVVFVVCCKQAEAHCSLTLVLCVCVVRCGVGWSEQSRTLVCHFYVCVCVCCGVQIQWEGIKATTAKKRFSCVRVFLLFFPVVLERPCSSHSCGSSSRCRTTMEEDPSKSDNTWAGLWRPLSGPLQLLACHVEGAWQTTKLSGIKAVNCVNGKERRFDQGIVDSLLLLLLLQRLLLLFGLLLFYLLGLFGIAQSASIAQTKGEQKKIIARSLHCFLANNILKKGIRHTF